MTVKITTIQLRRDTLANWELENPILEEGEAAFVTDQNKLKIGNGVNTYQDLPFISADGIDDAPADGDIYGRQDGGWVKLDLSSDFDPKGDYTDLRARATTKVDVGLSNVTDDEQVKAIDKATSIEAVDATDDTKWMTPFKTKEAIDEHASGGEGGEGGEVNTASNLGLGEGVFKEKVGEDLQFKSLTSDQRVSFITTDPDEIQITVNVDDKLESTDIEDFETSIELNSRDDANRDRLNHTGSQQASTISDFDNAVETNTAVQANTEKRSYPLADEDKLFGIESGAEVNQSDAEIKNQYEANLDTNAYTDSEKTKLEGVEDGAEVNQSDAEIKNQYEANLDTNAYTDSEKTKLEGVEDGAEVNKPTDLSQGGTGDQRTIESSTGTNVEVSTASTEDAGFMSTQDKTKLDNVEDGAEVNQSDAEIKNQYEANLDTNAYTDTEKTKLSGIENEAQANVNADWSATTGDEEILNKPNVPEKADDLTDVDVGARTEGQGLLFNASGDLVESELGAESENVGAVTNRSVLNTEFINYRMGLRNRDYPGVFYDIFADESKIASSTEVEIVTGTEEPSALLPKTPDSTSFQQSIDDGNNESAARFSTSPDGQFLTFHYSGSNVEVFDLSTLSYITTISEGSSSLYRGGDFSPDSKYFAFGFSGSSGDTYIYDVNTWTLVQSLGGTRIEDVTFSPNGKWLANTSWHDNVDIYEVGTWDLIESIPSTEIQFGVDFSPDSSMLAFSDNTYNTYIHSTEDWSLIETLSSPIDARDVHFSEYGEYILIRGGNENVYLYNTNTWDLVESFIGDSWTDTAGVFLANNSAIAILIDDDLFIYELPTLDLLHTETWPIRTLGPGTNPDKTELYVGKWDDGFDVLNVNYTGPNTGSLTTPEQNVGGESLMFSANGDFLDGSTTLDITDGTLTLSDQPMDQYVDISSLGDNLTFTLNLSRPTTDDVAEIHNYLIRAH